MKRFTVGKAASLLLSVMIMSGASACSDKSGAQTSSAAPSQAVSSEVSSPESAPLVTDPAEAALRKLEKTSYGGVVYIEIDGEPYFSYADGTLENEAAITLDTPLPIGSVSKQFCAASILLLCERGKLALTDALGKYFPEYEEGAGITLHDMLSMRSGIPEIDFSAASYDKTDEENTRAVLENIFSQQLLNAPNEQFDYKNSNYLILSNIVEKVSGMAYVDFVRENFWTPLGMTHTGSVDELPSSPGWAQGNVYTQLDHQPGLTKGAGDIISNAADMTIWLCSLKNGEVISKESFELMITDHSDGQGYGYAFRPGNFGGEAHAGENGIYTAFDYISEDGRITLFMASNTETSSKTSSLFTDIMTLMTQQRGLLQVSEDTEIMRSNL